MSTGTMTLEEVVAKSAESVAKLAESLAKIEAEKKESLAKIEAEKKESLARIEAEKKESLARIDADMKKYERERAAADRKFDQVLKVTGLLKLDYGRLTELILMPKIRKQINKHGHKFNIVSVNKEFHRADGDIMAEADLMLENCDEAMVIEIKSNFKTKNITEHLKRLELLRKNENITGMKNRAMYAGIAGVTITEKARDLALGHGMYVITMREEEDRVDVIAPKTKKKW